MIKEDLFAVKLEEKKVSKNIILYGTGTLAREVYEVLSNEDYKIHFFINRNFEYVNAVEDLAEVRKYDDKSITQQMKSEFTVIIATFSPYADIHKIISDLSGNGYKNIITYSELIDLFEDKFEEPIYLNKRKEFLQNKERISMAADLWSDEKSREIYESLVKFRITKNYKDLVAKDSFEEIYFPSDIEGLYCDDKINFIDCGAFDGDTIRALTNKFDNVKQIIAFEPEYENYSKIVTQVEEIRKRKNINSITLLPCAVYSETTQMKFNMGMQGGSNLDKDGSEVVQCVSMDECIRDFDATMIKMDVEGAEYEALLGCKNIIFDKKP
ncbi:MAG: FkbM family methyltransferase, partial [Clostridiaceae bacterium]|nr:FkbM family methyltransferase [Clostridiaceae bacterium]